MSWDTIFIVALAASIGMFAGLVLGWFLSPMIRSASKGASRGITGLLVVAGAFSGYAFLPKIITPYVQPQIDRIAGRPAPAPAVASVTVTEEIPQAVVEQEIDTALRELNNPFLEAVMEREPNRAQQVRTRLASAYRRGGEGALIRALMDADQEILQVSFPYYMARAQHDDLLAAVRQIRIVIDLLGRNDAMTCHAWLYGGMTGETFDFDRYLDAVGADQHYELQARLATVVRGANEILPDYDQSHAIGVLEEVRQLLNARLGDEKVGLITATQQPAGENDARLACEASGEYYDYILADERPVDVFRHRYAGGSDFQ